MKQTKKDKTSERSAIICDIRCFSN